MTIDIAIYEAISMLRNARVTFCAVSLETCGEAVKAKQNANPYDFYF